MGNHCSCGDSNKNKDADVVETGPISYDNAAASPGNVTRGGVTLTSKNGDPSVGGHQMHHEANKLGFQGGLLGKPIAGQNLLGMKGNGTPGVGGAAPNAGDFQTRTLADGSKYSGETKDGEERG
jgi:hypothetical protein